MKPDKVSYLVAFFARDYVPKIKAFLEAEYPDRQEGVEKFGALMRDIYPGVCQLQRQLPEALAEEMMLGLPAYFTLYEWEKDPTKWKKERKKALAAFLEGKDGPVDEYGNLDFVSGMSVSLMMLLNKTYLGLTTSRGLFSNFKDAEYSGSYFSSLYDQFEDEVFAKGCLKAIGDLKGIIPLIYEIERKLALYPPTGELEKM
ncbi:MAG: hypothetical protein ACFE8F_12090 [Promethearchaeota archaeon]